MNRIITADEMAKSLLNAVNEGLKEIPEELHKEFMEALFAPMFYGPMNGESQ